VDLKNRGSLHIGFIHTLSRGSSKLDASTLKFWIQMGICGFKFEHDLTVLLINKKV